MPWNAGDIWPRSKPTKRHGVSKPRFLAHRGNSDSRMREGVKVNVPIALLETDDCAPVRERFRDDSRP